MKRRNIILWLPEDLLRRRFELLRRAAAQMAHETESYEQARDGMTEDIKLARNLGTRGRITWDRDSLHER